MQLSTTFHNARQVNPERIVRAAILNGTPVPPVAAAVLEARGVNVGELEQRLRQNMEFRQ